MTDPKTVENRVDHVIETSLQGEGPLTKYFAGVRDALDKDIRQTYAFKRKQDPSTPMLTDEQIDAQVSNRLEQEVDAKIKPALMAAANGESNSQAGVDVKELSNMAGAVGTTVTAVSTMNPLAMLSAVPLLGSFSFLADIVKTGARYLANKFGDKQEGAPQTLQETWREVRSERYIGNLANELGADPQALFTALKTDPPSAQTEPAKNDDTPEPAEEPAQAAARAAAAAERKPEATQEQTPPESAPAETPPAAEKPPVSASPENNPITLDPSYNDYDGATPPADAKRDALPKGTGTDRSAPLSLGG